MLDYFPQEILFIIVEPLEKSQLLTSRLVNRTWNNIATDVLSRVHSHVQFRTTMCVRSFVNLMGNRSQPRIYTKFEFHFEYISHECIQYFANEIGPQVRDYSFNQFDSSELILKLLQSSPNLEVITIQGNFRTDEILDFVRNHHFPIYSYLRVINFKDSYNDFAEALKLLVVKAPNLKQIGLHYFRDTSEQVLHIIRLLQPTTKIKLYLKHHTSEATDYVDSLSKATVNIQDLYIDTPYYIYSTNMAQPILELLKSQSASLKKLHIQSCGVYSIPPLCNLKLLRITPQDYWDDVVLNPGDFPRLCKIELYNPCTLPMFCASTWPNVTTLQLGCNGNNGTTFLNEVLAKVFLNLQKLVLSSMHSLENDLKCCFRHFTQLQELSLEFPNLSNEFIPYLWDSITGGVTNVEESMAGGATYVDVETLLSFDDKVSYARDATMENLNLKTLRVKSCRPHTLNAIMYLSSGGNFKLELLDLTCHKECNLKALQGPVLKTLSKYHKSVIIH